MTSPCSSGQLEGLENLKGYTLYDNEDWQDRLADLSKGFAFSCEDDDCSSRFLFYSGRPRLGVQLTETTPELREHLGGSADAGVLVSKVIKGTAAADAGIEVGDLIVDVDGDEISSTNDLRRALAERDGEVFDIEVIRDGRSMRLSVTLEAPDEERPTGPRAWHRRVPRMIAPAIIAPRIAPRVIPRIAPRVVPQIREQVRLVPAVVEIEGTAPVLAVAPVAPVAIAPVAVTLPGAPVAVLAPSPMMLPVPEVDVVPMLAPMLAPHPDVPVPPSPAFPVLMKDDVI